MNELAAVKMFCAKFDVLTGNVTIARSINAYLLYRRGLDLAGCQLESVDQRAFVHLVALESLNLKQNKLRRLSETSFMNFAHLKSLDLDGNPWKCDCDLRGFRDWFMASRVRSESLVCTEPPHLIDVSWESLASAQFACAPSVTLAPYPQVSYILWLVLTYLLINRRNSGKRNE